MQSHSLTNFEIQKHSPSKSKFNGVYSKNSLSKIKKLGIYNKPRSV